MHYSVRFSVDVEAEHLLDDYWWVTATPAGTDPDDAAMAVVRITDSKHPLRYGRATRPASPDRTGRARRNPNPQSSRKPVPAMPRRFDEDRRNKYAGVVCL